MTRIAGPSAAVVPLDDGTAPPAGAPGPPSTLVRWCERAEAWLEHQGDLVLGQVESAALSVLERLPLKERSPFSTALLKHYVERSGEPYQLGEVPLAWQAWIEAATRGRVGLHRQLSPYNSGLYDLRNSLGHFDVEVSRNRDGTRTYRISDRYQFGALPHDRDQRGRHGFPLGALDAQALDLLARLLPRGEYQNPGGFTERWELRTIGRETFLFIPQAVLEAQGRPFDVTGSFTA
jgi:hypothetical protein